jgi:hypothetical protein
MPKTKHLPILDSVTSNTIEVAIVRGRVRIQFSITHGVELTPVAARALAKRLRELADTLTTPVI